MAAIQTKKPTNPGKGEPIGHRGSGPQQAQKGERADDEPEPADPPRQQGHAGDGRHDHRRARFSEGVVEADESDEPEDSAEDHKPGADEEQPAALVDVADLLIDFARFGDQNLNARHHHERDADDKNRRREDRAHAAHGRHPEVSHPGRSSRAPRTAPDGFAA